MRLPAGSPAQTCPGEILLAEFGHGRDFRTGCGQHSSGSSAAGAGDVKGCRRDRVQSPYLFRERTMKVVVIGGTGLIGSKVVTILQTQGHEAVAAAPNTGVNTLTGLGLE